MFDSHKSCERQLAQAQAQISDLTQAIIDIQRQFADERRDLLDRIMVLTHPGSIREVMVTRMPRKEPQKNEPKAEDKLFTPIANPAAFKPANEAGLTEGTYGSS